MKLMVCALAIFLGSAPCWAETAYEFPAPGQATQHLKIEASADIGAIEPLIRDFQTLEPGLSITYVDSLTNDLFDRMQAVCESGGSAPDLVFSSSVDHMVKLANDGCAQSHDSTETRRLPPFAMWHDEVFGFTFEPAVIVYNRDLVPPADVPLSRDALIDLLRTRADFYAGKVGTYDIARSGIGYLFAFFDAQQSNAFGRLLEGFGRASAKLYCCTGELLDDIESGRMLVGYNLLGSYAYGRYRGGAPIGIVLPRDYTLVLSRAAFIPRGAANATAGKRFLDYLLSTRGQRVAAERAFFFSFDHPMPEGVEGADPEFRAGVFRPIAIGPSLLAVTDASKRKRLLKDWDETLPSR